MGEKYTQDRPFILKIDAPPPPAPSPLLRRHAQQHPQLQIVPIHLRDPHQLFQRRQSVAITTTRLSRSPSSPRCRRLRLLTRNLLLDLLPGRRPHCGEIPAVRRLPQPEVLGLRGDQVVQRGCAFAQARRVCTEGVEGGQIVELFFHEVEVACRRLNRTQAARALAVRVPQMLSWVACDGCRHCAAASSPHTLTPLLFSRPLPHSCSSLCVCVCVCVCVSRKLMEGEEGGGGGGAPAREKYFLCPFKIWREQFIRRAGIKVRVREGKSCRYVFGVCTYTHHGVRSAQPPLSSHSLCSSLFFRQKNISPLSASFSCQKTPLIFACYVCFFLLFLLFFHFFLLLPSFLNSKGKREGRRRRLRKGVRGQRQEKGV